jgi:hypothetical protein
MEEQWVYCTNKKLRKKNFFRFLPQAAPACSMNVMYVCTKKKKKNAKLLNTRELYNGTGHFIFKEFNDISKG